MQVPDGQHLALRLGRQGRGPLTLTDVDAGGMAHHKIADRNWTKIPTNPAEDREERLLYPPSTAATVDCTSWLAAASTWRKAYALGTSSSRCPAMARGGEVCAGWARSAR